MENQNSQFSTEYVDLGLTHQPQIVKVGQARSLSDGLRLFGVISLICSGVFFMLQGLAALNSFERFISFAIVTVGLGALGLIVGGQMREPKSARAFLGLAAAATPVLFSQLGAMLYGIIDSVVQVPSVFVVKAPSLIAVLIAGISVTLAMAPILYIGFAAFYRQKAQNLVFLLLLSSALLLIPTRASNLGAVLLFIQIALLYAFEQLRSMHVTTTAESEKSMAKLICLIPVAIMIGRGLFYQPTELFFSAVAAAISIACLCYTPAKRLYFFGVIAGALSWYFAAHEFLGRNSAFQSTRFLIAGYSAAIIILLVAKPETGMAKRKALRFVGQMFAFYIPIFSFCTTWSYSMAMSLMVLGAMVMTLGYSRRDLSVVRSGGFAMILGLVYCMANLWEFALNTPWITLASVGVLVILLAGYLEKNRNQMSQLKKRCQDHFAFGPVAEIKR